MRIRILQCLCGPNRHAILGLTVDAPDDEVSDAQAREAFRLVVDSIVEGREVGLKMPVSRIDPWCGLCGAPAASWTYELAWSRDYPTYEAAMQAVRDNEAAQLVTAALMDLADASYTAQMRSATARHVDAAHHEKESSE